MVEKFTKFASKQGKESARTQDVIKSIAVFADQIYCLLKVPGLSDLVEDADFKALLAGPADKSPQDRLFTMKKNLLRFGAEEVLRRNINGGEKVVAEDKLADLLFPEHKEFVEKTFARREAELRVLNEAKADGNVDATFAQYDGDVARLKA